MSGKDAWVDRDTGTVVVVEVEDGKPGFGAVRDADGNWTEPKSLTFGDLAEFDKVKDPGTVSVLVKAARMALSLDPVRAK
jgi:hypothetical protein